MRGTDQTSYDRGTTVFSPDGRLYQVEYAREAVGRGAPAVGVRATDGVVLAALARPRSPLHVAGSVRKLFRADAYLGIASAGLAGDVRQLVDVARRRAQGERLRYGEPLDAATLAGALADHVQEYSQTGGVRPYGAALLVAGLDGGTPRLYEVDPGGMYSGWRAAAVGDADEARRHLEEAYGPDVSLEDAVPLALGALAATTEGAGLRPDRTAVARLTGDGYAALDDEGVEQSLSGAGLLDDAAS